MQKRALTPLLVVLLAACGQSATSDYPRSASQDDRWGVGVGFPVFESTDNCSADPSVERSLMTADMPTSRLAIRLNAGASEADALRVADCLHEAMSRGDITILVPRA